MAGKNQKSDPNRHIKEYLEYYVGVPEAPKYAVLINGPWGVGKTYIIKRLIEKFEKDGKKVIYVSLFGLSSSQQIDEALLAAVYPLIDLKVTRLGAKVGRGLLKKFGLEEMKASDLLTIPRADLYIFDDLERAGGSVNTVLGYINEFVEHDDAKVVVIANEAEIPEAERASYFQRKEKLIGKTLEAQSAFEEAFAYFIERTANKATRDILKENAIVVQDLYQRSGLNNLRILQQTIWDFERVVAALSAAKRKNKEAMKSLLEAIFVLSFELRSGRILATDLRGRMQQMIGWQMGSKDDPKPAVAAISERYPSVSITNSILGDAVLIDILTRGIVDKAAIDLSLDKSGRYRVAAKEPAWRTVWFWSERNDDEIAKAIVVLGDEYERREFVELGVFAHVVGLRLWLADAGIMKNDRADIVEGAKRYIDDLATQGRLANARETLADGLQFGGHQGLTINAWGSPEMKEVLSYWRETAKNAYAQTFPQIGEELLREIRSDPDNAYKRLMRVGGAEEMLLSAPILIGIDPALFVDTLLALPPAEQRQIISSLQGRYEFNALDRDLAPEKPWLVEVHKRLLEAASAANPIQKYRLLKFIEWHLAPVLASEDPMTHG